MALCRQGDEAVAVGLLAEALPDSPVDTSFQYFGTPVMDEVHETGDDPAAAASLLRKVKLRDVCCCCWMKIVVKGRCSWFVLLVLPSPAGSSIVCVKIQYDTRFSAFTLQLFRGAISDSVALSQASFHLDGRWASLQSLRACAPPGTASLLPLPQHWLFLPLASQVRFSTSSQLGLHRGGVIPSAGSFVTLAAAAIRDSAMLR